MKRKVKKTKSTKKPNRRMRRAVISAGISVGIIATVAVIRFGLFGGSVVKHTQHSNSFKNHAVLVEMHDEHNSNEDNKAHQHHIVENVEHTNSWIKKPQVESFTSRYDPKKTLFHDLRLEKVYKNDGLRPDVKKWLKQMDDDKSTMLAILYPTFGDFFKCEINEIEEPLSLIHQYKVVAEKGGSKSKKYIDLLTKIATDAKYYMDKTAAIDALSELVDKGNLYATHQLASLIPTIRSEYDRREVYFKIYNSLPLNDNQWYLDILKLYLNKYINAHFSTLNDNDVESISDILSL